MRDECMCIGDGGNEGYICESRRGDGQRAIGLPFAK